VTTTMTVSDAAQRSGMSESDLRALNNIAPRLLIKAGSTLIVPRTARVQEDVAAAVAESGHLSFQPEIVTRRTVVSARRNEDVASVARRYGVSAASVADWNDVKSNHVFSRGYKVVVYLPVRASRTAAVGSGARGSHRGKAPVLTSKSSRTTASKPAPSKSKSKSKR